ncbi:CDP-diacylglycerol--glycerol-3-phosphate 3-phosphatidyltransferase NDAI_0G04350 [Naumovozyma dairenensis CBS 421]|uniref:CDP-diacylglycerol--glycerol-3-phosphate 3-phosphatidyltransferase n=1 Tax=Naumovozyma dairenensis (strain ATCC 10597 / BCRC 20456 / CBS 421 / NBRC 0211 / NRRL Y-12639) TaxID=1071378 RepID=J7SBN0_NAUDC|nr:hypothetical protein NDAI_0G04350 [Naumovozyma dairenensis CBS 421]CCK73420.1 hypothetical protein NDAI_0G04350 [Naumovozyma dairenensis CBS 421]
MIARSQSLLFIPKHTVSMSSKTSSLPTPLSSFLRTKFYFEKGQIEIIDTPTNFYNTLKFKISTAERRIFLASLYLGKTENEFIECISTAMTRNPQLKLYFLIDGLRGTRESPDLCSASMLAKLDKQFGDRVDLRLYRTPKFIGWKKLIPKRFNEGIGLQHMKIYGFDDEVILSGANLSNDYFTDRQDRYYLFKSCPAFASYYFKLQQLVSSISYRIQYSSSEQEKYKLSWPQTNLIKKPATLLTKHHFVQKTSKALTEFLYPDSTSAGQQQQQQLSKPELDCPTVVYPISQFTPLYPHNKDQSTEKPTIIKLLQSKSTKKPWLFTAGYFNIHSDLKRTLLETPTKDSLIITASPKANGFYKSKGASGMLPDAYLYLSYKFLKAIPKMRREDIRLKEWQNGIANTPGGWSYHAKGIWFMEKDTRTNTNTNGYIPYLTIIGSSNYTRRSYSLDLETNCVIFTKDESLQLEMKKELDKLLMNTKEVTLNDFKNDKERHVSKRVKLATNIFGKRL